jgi:phosphoribosyl 1,2-cyclic phosphodiesterase
MSDERWTVAAIGVAGGCIVTGCEREHCSDSKKETVIHG